MEEETGALVEGSAGATEDEDFDDGFVSEVFVSDKVEGGVACFAESAGVAEVELGFAEVGIGGVVVRFSELDFGKKNSIQVSQLFPTSIQIHK